MTDEQNIPPGAPASKEHPRRRPRRMAASEGPKVPHEGTLEVREVEIDGRRYVQRYNRCGRKCRRCGPQHERFDPLRPGHGPYWYRIFRQNGRLQRRYIGKELKTDGTE